MPPSYFARQHGIPTQQARELIDPVGNERAKLNEAAGSVKKHQACGRVYQTGAKLRHSDLVRTIFVLVRESDQPDCFYLGEGARKATAAGSGFPQF